MIICRHCGKKIEKSDSVWFHRTDFGWARYCEKLAEPVPFGCLRVTEECIIEYDEH